MHAVQLLAVLDYTESVGAQTFEQSVQQILEDDVAERLAEHCLLQ